MTCGADCTYSLSKGTLAKYAAACQYVQPDYVVSAKLAEAKGTKTASAAYYLKVSPLMQAGVNVSKALTKDSEVDIELGCAYKLDKNTSVKAKSDTAGFVTLSYKQKLSKLTTMTLVAQIDAVEGTKNKFGMALNLTPEF